MPAEMQVATEENFSLQLLSTRQDTHREWTVIEYPDGCDVVVDLIPHSLIPGAKGFARIKRSGGEITIAVSVTGLFGDRESYSLYSVAPTGKVTALGVMLLKDGNGSIETTTNIHQFMLLLSPENKLTSLWLDMPIILQRTIPEGFTSLQKEEVEGPTRSDSEKGQEEAIEADITATEVNLRHMKG